MDNYIMWCFIILITYCDLQVTSIPVSAGPQKSVLSSTLVASICAQHVSFAATEDIQEALRNKLQFIYKPLNTNHIKWTNCRTQDTKCTKFSQTKSNASLFGGISNVVPNEMNTTVGNNETGKSSKIYGGRYANRNEFPWLVSIEKGENCGHACGGTILDPETILTAAHCVWNIAHTYLIVNAGDHRKDVFEADQQARIVTFCTPHPGFDGLYGEDIAICKLLGALIFTPTIHAIGFTKYNPDLYPPQTTFVINGWGYFNDSNIGSTFLKAAEVKLMPFRECNAIHALHNYAGIKNFEFCTGYTPGTSQCRGDSGGGLILTTGGVPYLAGVTAHIFKCGFTPSVYVNVFLLEGWIRANM